MRKKIEAKIKKILSFLDDKSTDRDWTNQLKIFSDTDLMTVLTFLENGDYGVIYKLVEEKIDQYRQNADKIKILGSKIQIASQQSQEEKERTKEAQDIENLITF